jgi:hypothetical protein
LRAGKTSMIVAASLCLVSTLTKGKLSLCVFVNNVRRLALMASCKMLFLNQIYGKTFCLHSTNTDGILKNKITDHFKQCHNICQYKCHNCVFFLLYIKWRYGYRELQVVGRRAFNPFSSVTIFMGKWYCFTLAIMTLSFDQCVPFNHVFTSTFDVEYVGLQICSK